MPGRPSLRPTDAGERTHATRDRVSDAIESALARFAGAVRAAGARYRIPPSDQEEFLQSVRVRLWRALERGERIEAAPASYLYRAASTAAVDLVRQRHTRRAAASVELDAAGFAVPDPAPRPDPAAEGSELVRQVERAIETIAPARRPVVRMYLAGHPREEIAQLMGWTEAKTRNLLYRGLADLRERLAAQGIGTERTR